MGERGYNIEQRMDDQIAQFIHDPLGYVMWSFPWDSDPGIQLVKLPEAYKERFPNCEYGPDQWACEFLDDLGAEVKKRGFDLLKPEAKLPIRFTTSSGHGIGKSTMVAWLIKWILDCYPMSKGVVTANTNEQLRTKTWAQVSTWNAMSMTAHRWKVTTGKGSMAIARIASKHIAGEWRCDAQSCSPDNSEAFAGHHAAKSVPFMIFDEASGIDGPIWEARQGASTDGMPMFFDWGNPTRKDGWFYENTFGKYSHRFNVRVVDSRDVQITNKAQLEEWAEDWGEDSDLFKVRVRGLPPSISNLQFINSDDIRDAMRRKPEEDPSAPLVIGVDVARFGDNDTVIYPRIGNDASSFPYYRYNRLDTQQVADKVVDVIDYFREQLGKECRGLFVDGGGIGGGVVDRLRHLGYNPIDVNLGSKPNDQKYRRKGDELWGKLRDAMGRLSLPEDSELEEQLAHREYGITEAGQKIHLESKKDMSERVSKSPDIADALALTFAQKPAPETDQVRTPQQAVSEYDPLDTNW